MVRTSNKKDRIPMISGEEVDMLAGHRSDRNAFPGRAKASKRSFNKRCRAKTRRHLNDLAELRE